MRTILLLIVVASLAACTGTDNSATEYSDPQPAPAAKPAPSTGVSVSGYARVGVGKG